MYYKNNKLIWFGLKKTKSVKQLIFGLAFIKFANLINLELGQYRHCRPST